MDAYIDRQYGAGAGATSSMQRLLRLRSETLHWTSSLNPSNKSGPVNAQGFYINSSDVSSLNLSPASVAGWKVWAFHSWTKSRHTVRAVDLDADPAKGAKMLFEQDTDFPYGQYTYCSLERYYIEGAPELLQRPASDVRGGFLILPEAGSHAPGNASCGSVPCQVCLRKSLVAAAVASQATLGLPVTPDMFIT